MKTICTLLAALMMICGCTALAEGASSQSVYGPDMAVVNGEVWCFSAGAPIWERKTLWRITPEGREAAMHSHIGWWAIYALEDGRLLLIENVLNLGELLGSAGMSGRVAKIYDPATGKTTRLCGYNVNDTDGACQVFAAQGVIYREVQHDGCHEIQRRDGDRWTALATWQGEDAWPLSTFCVIGGRLRLMDYEQGSAGMDVSFLWDRLREDAWTGVKEGDVMYKALDGYLTALRLDTGAETRLVPLRQNYLYGFLLTEDRAILLYNAEAEVYSRATWEKTASVPLPAAPVEAWLEGDRLVVYCPYQGAAAGEVNLATGESILYDFD